MTSAEQNINTMCGRLQCTPRQLALILWRNYPEYHTYEGADTALAASLSCDSETLTAWRKYATDKHPEVFE